MSPQLAESGTNTETDEDLNRLFPLSQIHGTGNTSCPLKKVLQMKIGKEGIIQGREQVVDVLCPEFEDGKCWHPEQAKGPCSLSGLRSYVVDSLGKTKTLVKLNVLEK